MFINAGGMFKFVCDSFLKTYQYYNHSADFYIKMILLSVRGKEAETEIMQVGAFTRFMASIPPKENRSKPYYHVSLLKAPSKAVVYTLMEKVADAALMKNMPFIQFVDDQPIYALMVELKYENKERFKNVLPVLVPFHAQGSYMHAIFNQELKLILLSVLV